MHREYKIIVIISKSRAEKYMWEVNYGPMCLKRKKQTKLLYKLFFIFVVPVREGEWFSYSLSYKRNKTLKLKAAKYKQKKRQQFHTRTVEIIVRGYHWGQELERIKVISNI